MNTVFPQIVSLITQPPGNLIYHLILVFSILTALQTTAMLRSFENQTTARRLISGFFILLFGQIILFLITALIWQRLFPNPFILTSLDKALTFLSIAVAAWMWNYSLFQSKADLVLISLILLGSTLLFIDLTLRTNAPNLTPIEWMWAWANLIVIGLSMLLLIGNKHKLWEIGLSFCLIVFAGTAVSLFYIPEQTSSSAVMRLALLCAFPLLPSITRVLLPSSSPLSTQLQTKTESKPPRVALPESRLILSWLGLTTTKTSQQAIGMLTAAIGKTFSSDLTFLVRQENPYRPLLLEAGYDLIRDEALPPLKLDTEQLPLISHSIQKEKSLKITIGDENQPQDLLSLTRAVGLAVPGHILLSPIPNTTDGKRAILLFTPYSKHEWSVEEQMLLSTITGELTEFFAQLANKQALEDNFQNLQAQLKEAQEQIKSLQEKLIEKNQPASTLTQPALLAEASSLEIAGLIAIQREAQETIQRLEAENRSLREALRDLRGKTITSSDVEHLEKELRQALEEVARLQNALANANMRILELQFALEQGQTPNQKGIEVIFSIIQELRQPIASLVGFTELLINDATTNAAPQQQELLEGIRSATNRIQLLISNLLEISALNSSPIELAPQPLDVETVLDQVITDISDLLQQKQINLLMDIPTNLPTFYADRDALHQALIHLLRNAANVTPPEGNITLRAKVEQGEKNSLFILFQITDEGGGIPPDQIWRVFSYQIKDSSPAVRGIDDSGLGLSIAKTLIEAHDGRIWVESDGERTSTFTILLPVKAPAFSINTLVS